MDQTHRSARLITLDVNQPHHAARGLNLSQLFDAWDCWMREIRRWASELETLLLQDEDYEEPESLRARLMAFLRDPRRDDSWRSTSVVVRHACEPRIENFQEVRLHLTPSPWAWMVFGRKPEKYLVFFPHRAQQLNNQRFLLLEMLALGSYLNRRVVLPDIRIRASDANAVPRPEDWVWHSVSFDTFFDPSSLAPFGALLWSDFGRQAQTSWQVLVAAWLQDGGEYSFAQNETNVLSPCSAVNLSAESRSTTAATTYCLRRERSAGISLPIFESLTALQPESPVLALVNLPWDTFDISWSWREKLGLSLSLAPRLRSRARSLLASMPPTFLGVHWRAAMDWRKQPARWAPDHDLTVAEVARKIQKALNQTGLEAVFIASDASAEELAALSETLSARVISAGLEPSFSNAEVGLIEQECLMCVKGTVYESFGNSRALEMPPRSSLRVFRHSRSGWRCFDLRGAKLQRWPSSTGQTDHPQCSYCSSV